MAQEPRSPWSRWDLPIADVRPSPVGSKQFDYPPNIPPSLPGAPPPPGYFPSPTGSSDSSGPAKFVEATLITKELNANDDSFYNCIYGIPNSLQQVIQECHVDVDCCETTCCDSNWKSKYAVAVTLLSLFCLIVLISLLIWLIVWLVNRSRDKKQREKFAEAGLSPYSAQANMATPYATIQQHQQQQPIGTLNNRRF